MQPVRIYLDVDGVVLDKHQQPSACLHEYIDHITTHYECYWLTTHVTDGTTDHLFAYLRRNGVPEATLALMERIQGTAWDMLKTDGIDLKSKFWWFDDMPTEQELLTLDQHGVADRIIWIDREKGDGLCTWLRRDTEREHSDL